MIVRSIVKLKIGPTAYLAVKSGRGITVVRCNAARTAVKRHSPQQTCPHGVSVAFVGGEKHIGHMYAERGSGPPTIALEGGEGDLCLDEEATGLGEMICTSGELGSSRREGDSYLTGVESGISIMDLTSSRRLLAARALDD